jgi:fatty-acyl-CoA synthase
VLRDALVERAGADCDRVAFVDSEAQLTFGELTERACSRAAALQAIGVAPRDRVALAMSAGIPFVEVFWALQLLGSVPCAFNPRVPHDTLARRIERVRPVLVVTDETAAAMSRGRAGLEETEIVPDDLAFLQLTSGTTGAPRASMIRQRNVIASMRQSEALGHLGRDDVLVGWVPPWHDLGLVRFVIEPVWRGIRCHIVAPAIRTIPEWLTTISEVGGTWSGAPDFAYRLATRMVDPARVCLSTLRVTINGGEPVRRSSIEQFERHFSISGVVMPGYGLGEATLGVTMNRRGEEIPVDERGNVSCGRPLPGVEVKAGGSVEDATEILVRGDAVFSGYFEAPDETARALRDGWLHTGDTGYQDADGRLFVLGRRAGMIKRAGALIAPRELEEAAQRAVGVGLAAATSQPAAQAPGDATIVVAVEADPSTGRSTEQIATDVSREIVAALGFAPGRVAVLSPRSIPRTENGKVRHDRLADLLR